MSKRGFFKIFGLVIALICFNIAQAADLPITMMQNVSSQVLAKLKENRPNLKTNPQIAYNIIKRELLPHVDIQGMARSVLGREVWQKASPAEKQQFMQQFTELLIRTYAKAFSAYRDESIKFYPIRGGMAGNRVQIQSEIIRSSGPAIAVNYRLILLGGNWKVYDFSVENISMLQSFRSQFNEELNRGGLAALLKKLAQHNAGKA